MNHIHTTTSWIGSKCQASLESKIRRANPPLSGHVNLVPYQNDYTWISGIMTGDEVKSWAAYFLSGNIVLKRNSTLVLVGVLGNSMMCYQIGS